MRLYRQVLKTTYDWAVHRHIFLVKAKEARAAFDANKDVRDDVRIEGLVAKAEEWLYEHQHPEPYTFPTLPGGSKHDRNRPPHPMMVRDPFAHGHDDASHDEHGHHAH